MKTFEIWAQRSIGMNNTSALHILKAENFYYADGVYLFRDENGNILHAIVAAPGILVRTAD